MIAEQLAQRLGARKVGAEFLARCPVHDDDRPSLNFRDRDGRLVVTCRAGCAQADVWSALRAAHPDLIGAPRPLLQPACEKRYRICDAAGAVQAVHVRRDGPDGKVVFWERLDGTRGLGGRPAAELPLYGSETLAGHPDAAVVLVEGEKTADAAIEHGFLALGTVTGASGCPGSAALEVVHGRRVILWPDADAPGLQHMRRIARALDGIAADVSIVKPPAGARAGFDAADLPATWEGALEALTLVSNARPFDPTECETCGSDACAGCETATTEASSWHFLRPLTVAALYADKALGAIRWLWDGMFPDGALILVASFQKEGKSTWLYALLAALVRGRDFLGRATRAVRVLVLAVEEHTRDVLAHLRESGIGPDDERLIVHSGRYPATPEGYTELRSFIRHNGIELLVVDTLARFWCVRDENANAEVIEKAGPLLDLARDEHVTVLLLFHTTDKHGAGASEFRHGREIRGASALFGLVDQAFVLSRAKGQADTVRVLRSVGRYRETPAELLMDFDPETGAYRLLETAENAGADRRQAREHKLLGYIAEHPGHHRTDVQRGARVNRGEGLALLGRLVSEGRIEERDGGLYLPVSGSGVVGEPAGTYPKGSGFQAPPKGGCRNPTPTLAEPAGTDAEAKRAFDGVAVGVRQERRP